MAATHGSYSWQLLMESTHGSYSWNLLMPGALEVGEAHELVVARRDALRRERMHPLQAELLTGERAHDVAVDQRAPVVRRRQVARGRDAAGQIAQEAAREGVAGSRRVAHVFQWVCRRGEERAVRAEEQRTVRPLLHHQHAWAQRQDGARRRPQTRRL